MKCIYASLIGLYLCCTACTNHSTRPVSIPVLSVQDHIDQLLNLDSNDLETLKGCSIFQRGGIIIKFFSLNDTNCFFEQVAVKKQDTFLMVKSMNYPTYINVNSIDTIKYWKEFTSSYKIKRIFFLYNKLSVENISWRCKDQTLSFDGKSYFLFYRYNKNIPLDQFIDTSYSDIKGNWYRFKG